MIYEKKKLLIDRLVLLGVLIVGVLAVIFIGVYKSNRELKVLNDSCELIDYDETLNQTKCEMEISLNYKVGSGYVAVAFYDANDMLLVQDEYYFFADGKTFPPQLACQERQAVTQF